MTTTAYSVEGMTCGGCAKRVRTAIEENVPGLSEIKIDPQAGRVEITSEGPISDDAVQAAVETTKYKFAGVLA
jgi:copper chaperone CopZ